MVIDEQTTLKQMANFPESENWPPASRKVFVHDRVVCHNCGERGHKSTYCQKDKADVIIDYDERVKCFGCGQIGHRKNICPLRKSEERRRSTSRDRRFKLPQKRGAPPTGNLKQEIEEELKQLRTDKND